VSLEIAITLGGFLVSIAVQAGMMLNQARNHSAQIAALSKQNERMSDKLDQLTIKVAHLEGQKAGCRNDE
jgi:hypothetical protein